MRRNQHRRPVQGRRDVHRRLRRAVQPIDYQVDAIPTVSVARTRLTIVNIVMGQPYVTSTDASTNIDRSRCPVPCYALFASFRFTLSIKSNDATTERFGRERRGRAFCRETGWSL